MAFRFTKNSLKITSLIIFCVAIAAIATSERLTAQISPAKNSLENSDDQVAGITSLMSAVSSDDIEGVKFFAKGGADIINQKNAGGATALHIAARQNNFEIAKILIENGANVNASDNESWTPLMRAALANAPEIVDLFLDNKADANYLNSEGESVILQAVNSDCAKCLNSILTKANFAKSMDLKLLQSQLDSAFEIARNRENQAIIEIVTAYKDNILKISNLLEPKSEDLPDPEKNNESSTLATHEYKITDTATGKRFKFVVGKTEENAQIITAKEDEKITVKKSEKIDITNVDEAKNSYLTNNSNTQEQASQENSQPIDITKKDNTSIELQSVTKKKFSFIKAKEDQSLSKTLESAINAQKEVKKPDSEIINQNSTLSNQGKSSEEEVVTKPITKKKFIFKSIKN